jgi:YHS domain-containing protein
MLRFLIYSLILFLVLRALSRFWGGVRAGMQGGQASPRARTPTLGVQMARDPICGTFVVPDRATALTTGRQTVYFCSPACRDRFTAGTADRARHAEEASGRTA